MAAPNLALNKRVWCSPGELRRLFLTFFFQFLLGLPERTPRAVPGHDLSYPGIGVFPGIVAQSAAIAPFSHKSSEAVHPDLLAFGGNFSTSISDYRLDYA
jgi:hypothetical protein